MDKNANSKSEAEEFDLDIEGPLFAPETDSDQKFPTGGCPTLSLQCTNGGTCTSSGCC